MEVEYWAHQYAEGGVKEEFEAEDYAAALRSAMEDGDAPGEWEDVRSMGSE